MGEPAPWPLKTSAYPGIPLELVSVRKPEGWPREREE